MVICKSSRLEQIFLDKLLVPQLDKTDAAFYGPKDSWTCPPLFSLHSRINPVHSHHIFFNIHFYIFPSIHRFYRWFSQASQLEPCVHVSSFLYVPHYRAISFFDHLKRVWCGSTDHKASHYLACPTSITLSLIDPDILLSTLCSSSVRPSFTSVQNNRKNYTSLYFNVYVMW